MIGAVGPLLVEGQFGRDGAAINDLLHGGELVAKLVASAQPEPQSLAGQPDADVVAALQQVRSRSRNSGHLQSTGPATGVVTALRMYRSFQHTGQ